MNINECYARFAEAYEAAKGLTRLHLVAAATNNAELVAAIEKAMAANEAARAAAIAAQAVRRARPRGVPSAADIERWAADVSEHEDAVFEADTAALAALEVAEDMAAELVGAMIHLSQVPEVTTNH